MTWLRLAYANLILSPLTTIVNVILMALGTASIVLLLLAGTQLQATMARDAQGVDLVLGASGSPVQLILSAVYHADVPPGNIKLADTRRWAEDPRIKTAVPVSLGDSYRGFRIVGTTPEYVDLYGAKLTEGAMWNAPMQAVLGAGVAASGALSLNSVFAGAHGLVDGGHDHDEQKYRVVGVLAPTGTVIDRLVLTSLESVWVLHAIDGHDHGHDEDHGHADEHNHEQHDHEHEEQHDHGHEHEEQHDHDHEHEEQHDHDHEREEQHDHDHEHEEQHDHGHEHEEQHDHGHEEQHEHEAEHEHVNAHDRVGEDADEHNNAHKHEDDEAHKHDEHGEVDNRDAHAGELAYASYDEELEVTAMLMTYSTPLAATTLPQQINAEGALQAASPAMEISRVLQLVGVGLGALGAFAWVLVATAALSIFAALYGSLRARRGELAMLRCLGASRMELLFYLVVEGVLMTLMGIALGVLVGHVVMELVGMWLSATRGIDLTGWAWPRDETLLIVGLVVVGIVSAIIPAVQAYRTDVARTLAEG